MNCYIPTPDGSFVQPKMSIYKGCDNTSMNLESRNDSVIFQMHRDSSGIDSELSFEQQKVLHVLETAVLCLFPNPYTYLNLK